ncbi:hypothetical protein DY000_02062790 [Brassica cretica]|uniref:Uncharacterized protein n=1 Tax=Brassica cretica TaxID=69181 RepID=A0ABQ7AQK9_BRACR|nr:hypothetical protein DY000_02062790 [Brassica cretica]
MNSLQLQSEVTTATPRGCSGCVDSRARSPKRHPEVARVVSIPERGRNSDIPRSLGLCRFESDEQAGSDVPQRLPEVARNTQSDLPELRSLHFNYLIDQRSLGEMDFSCYISRPKGIKSEIYPKQFFDAVDLPGKWPSKEAFADKTRFLYKESDWEDSITHEIIDHGLTYFTQSQETNQNLYTQDTGSFNRDWSLASVRALG